ncbi:GSU2403 family nucleotidyltransferase fold protein [Bradyrhizobium ivorense]|uniref:GSU2403 family nucleotidyltransferase fold protein n=1 Tax=Bradyrhizobium ivorense TaxID=2511166 RepID=UPI0010B43CCB|nr:GSU2403 family nucleotidyltransferase fold protein [Bradyrhizobium ivorense]VIO79215.1 hypothetical protein CI41S_67830 [Bradyrhizobium ivorense]
MPAPSLVSQTTYAELLERTANAAFQETFAENGAFTSKTVNQRKYWYFQTGTGPERSQRYVGPETPELLEKIERHKEIREDERERRTLVSTLVRSLGLPRPAAEIGEIIAALARAGVFRLRGVLVGTIAYQTYAAMLGLRLPSASTITMDIDIAQFTNVSIAIGDRTAPMLEVLKEVNKSFRPVSNVVDGRRATSYSATGGLRVDFLTPDDHAEMGRPQKLPALQTDAQPLHFLDFLIRDPEPAVVLHGAGIYVHVPAPARYAVHKLIISRRRPEGFAKRDKDLHQAEVLLAALAEKRPHDLKSAWEEAYERGPKWRQLMIEGLGLLEPLARDVVLDNIGAPRSILPGIDLSFDNPPARYDFSRDIVTFVGKALGSSVNCAISREAMDDHFGSDGLGQEGRLEAFLKNRSRIEAIARAKYLSAPVEEPGSLLIRTSDVGHFSQHVLANKPRESGKRPASPKRQ